MRMLLVQSLVCGVRTRTRVEENLFAHASHDGETPFGDFRCASALSSNRFRNLQVKTPQGKAVMSLKTASWLATPPRRRANDGRVCRFKSTMAAGAICVLRSI